MNEFYAFVAATQWAQIASAIVSAICLTILTIVLIYAFTPAKTN